jgi:KaiC/GvpD/RAD55 family RecA-like ATPase
MPKPRHQRTIRNDLESIPDELKRFLKLDTYSLLIKGNCGTGKTTLSLTILKTLKATKNFFYISTRTSPEQLFSYYPWLSKFVKPADDIQFSKADEQLSHPYFEDARLDEPESLFERITNELMDIKSPIIVIDSWDAIASLMDKESRINNERVLQTWRERAKAKIIFITEGVQESPLDFMVDGVLELSNDIYSGTHFRRMSINKLRGVAIDNTSYLFSLKDNMVRFFHKYVPSRYTLTAPNAVETVYPATETAGIVSLKSGFIDLDVTVGGGLRKGDIIFMETSKILSNLLPSIFLEKIIKEFIYKDGGIFLRSSPVLFHVNNAVDLIQHRDETNNPVSRYVGPLSTISNVDESESKPGITCLGDFLESGSNRQVLNIMGLSDLEKEMVDLNLSLHDIVGLFKKHFALTFVITDGEQDICKYLPITDIDLKFELIHGTLILRCALPPESVYGVNYNEDSRGMQLHKIL